MKLPRTKHIEGSRVLYETKDSDSVNFSDLKDKFLIIEEKLDGSGVSIFFDQNLDCKIWHRGSPAIGKEYKPLYNWIDIHIDRLFDLLGTKYILFGEWLFKKRTKFYNNLPCYFFESDIYDSQNDIWLSTSKRQELLKEANFIQQVPILTCFKPSSLSQIISLAGKSLYINDNWKNILELKCNMGHFDLDKILQETEQNDLMEGLYIKYEDDNKVLDRYKYVRYNFLKTILNSKTHIIDREFMSNELGVNSQCY